jgi:solute carrier family 25 carnitine/acylcarnitine transporter 20/29
MTSGHSKTSLFFTDFIAGAIGGGLGILAGQPLDVLKTRAMASSATSVSLLSIIRNEGVRALFKGAVPPVVGQGLYTSLAFSCQNATLAFFQASGAETKTRAHVFAAGCISGLVGTLVVTPCEVLKIYLQMNTSVVRQTVRDVAIARYKADGLSAFTKGWSATAIRDSPATGVYFLGYDILKCKTGNYFDRTTSELVSGGFAGVLSWAVSIPADVIKTRIQYGAVKGGFLFCANQILNQEGVHGLFRGAVPCLLRAFPVNAVIFFGYEETIRFVNFNR